MNVVRPAAKMRPKEFGPALVAQSDLLRCLLPRQAQPLTHVGDAVGCRGDNADVQG